MSIKLLLPSILSLFLVAIIASPAAADDGVAGKYDVTFDEVTNSCRNVGMSFRKTTVEITRIKRKRVDVTVPMVPIMKGVASKGGKFKAKAKKGRTGTKGIDGAFNVSGRVNDGVLQMLLVAEYFRGKTPLCTQSWNASGVAKK